MVTWIEIYILVFLMTIEYIPPLPKLKALTSEKLHKKRKLNTLWSKVLIEHYLTLEEYFIHVWNVKFKKKNHNKQCTHVYYMYHMCHSSQPFCTRHVPGFGLVGQTPGPFKMLSRWDGLLGHQAWVRRAPLYACRWIHLRMQAHA